MEPSSSSSPSEDVPSSSPPAPPAKESSPSPTEASDPPPTPPSPIPDSAPPPAPNSSPNRSSPVNKPPSNTQPSPESPPAPSLSPPSSQSPQTIPEKNPSLPSPVNSSPLPDEPSTLPTVREPAIPASPGLQQSPPSPTGFSQPSSSSSSPLPPNDPTLPLNQETPSSTLVDPPVSGGSPSGSVSSSSTPPDTKGFNITVIPVGYPNRASRHNTTTFIAAAAVGSVLLIMVIAIFLFARKRRKREEYIPPNNVSPEPDGMFYIQPPSNHSHVSQLSPVGYSFGSQTGNTHSGGTTDSGVIGSSKTLFSYEELMEITDGFSSQNIIGEGGFGCVYKGCVQDGTMVAVKHLKVGGGQGDREFKAEVEIISRIHHRHLVSLVGYCISNNQRLLIYDFVPNKTLEHHLHANGLPALDWSNRLKIAIGSAKGLAYLHEDCHPKIIHRDIKSANILLDDDFEAQVADFGLAKLNDSARSHVSTRVMGTFGYMAPEYASSGKLTDKSDVFSFGVVLLELITGRKPVDTSRPLGDESLVEWARDILVQAIESGDLAELVDPRLENNYEKSEMFRMIETAAACVRHSALKRPSMVQVVRLLDSKNELSDLTNGVKFGKSIEYDSGQYSEDIRNFRRSAPGGGGASSDTGEYASGDASHGLPI